MRVSEIKSWSAFLLLPVTRWGIINDLSFSTTNTGKSVMEVIVGTVAGTGCFIKNPLLPDVYRVPAFHYWGSHYKLTSNMCVYQQHS